MRRRIVEALDEAVTRPSGVPAPSTGRRDAALAALVAIVGGVVYLPGLGAGELQVFDEAIYASAARHMLESGRYLVPRLYWTTDALTPFFQKPPLGMWLQAASMAVLGVDEFAVRLPSAVATVSLGVVAFGIGSDRYDWRTGFAGALVLFVVPDLYFWGHSGRSASLDAPFVLFGTVFVWLAWRATDDWRWFVPAGVAAGLAVLTKGIAAGVFLLILAPLVASHLRAFVSREGVRGALAGVATMAPWPIYAWSRYPRQFVQGTVFRQIERSRGGITTEGDPLFQFMNYPYFKVLLFRPLSLAFLLTSLLGAALALRRDEAGPAEDHLFLVWWLIVPPVGFALLGGNHGWYVLPMYVPGAVLVGVVCSTAAGWIDRVAEAAVGQALVTDGRYVVVGILAVGVLLATYAAVGYGPDPPRNGQKELGQAFSSVPEDEAIFVENGSMTIENAPNAHYAFDFYVTHPLTGGEVGELRERRDVRYAVVSRGSLGRIGVDYRVLARSAEARAVAIELRR